MTDRDLSAELCALVSEAHATGEPLLIRGGGSKQTVLARNTQGTALDVSNHRGVIAYEPKELVITVRAGTPVREVQHLLAQHRQTLACEPPELDGCATIGGTLACDLSGGARPWAGSLRDAVLGVELINGRGELLNFGGTVMKNVAGYDVSRLQAGALGTLGVMTRISLRTLPLPEETMTMVYRLSATDALAMMRERAREPAPLSGAAWCNGELRLRLSGTGSAVNHCAITWGGNQDAAGNNFWQALTEMQLPFFHAKGVHWRLSVNPASKLHSEFGPTLIDWAGAQRWLVTETEQHAASIYQAATDAHGFACQFSGGSRQGEVRSALGAAQQAIHQRLKLAFDPQGILNPGRLYSWM